MRFAAISICFFLSVPAWSADDSLRVYVCDTGEVKTQVWNAQNLPVHAQLVRSGNAYWLDGRIDQPTSSAMFEGAGIWSFAPIQELFIKVRTKTASSVLAAIAMAESARNGRPWPWTINHQGKGIYFDTKEQAIAAAMGILRSGDTLFDVGLMQVNWHYNGHRFASLDAAFEPLLNIRVADEILQEHLKSTGSMEEAIGRYHSKTDSLKGRYFARVLNQIEKLSNQSAKPAPSPRC